MIGEFSNNHSLISQTESADRIWKDNKEIMPIGFEGTYRSTWFEPDLNEPVLARLEITPTPTAKLIFDLQWYAHDSDTPLFIGQAMIGEGLLIGNYSPA